MRNLLSFDCGGRSRGLTPAGSAGPYDGPLRPSAIESGEAFGTHVLALTIEAITGAGGIASGEAFGTTEVAVGFSPAHLNPVAWFDASEDSVYSDAGSTLCGDTDDVQQWSDLSGNDNHISESTNKPQYLTGQQNSLPGIRFATGELLTEASTGLLSGELTAFVCCKPKANMNNNTRILDQGGFGYYSTGTMFFIDAAADRTLTFYYYASTDVFGEAAGPTGATPSGVSNTAMIVTVFKDTHSNIRLNGNTKVTSANAIDDCDASGAFRLAVDTGTMEYYEVILYDSLLTDDQIDDVEEYLQAKWASQTLGT